MRQFYDWFHRYYGLVERNLSATLAEAVATLDPNGTRFRDDSFLELACGSANLGLLMAPRVNQYAGRDQSANMLTRARQRWASELDPAIQVRYSVAPFDTINLLEVTAEELGTPDWIGISFALHLFSPDDEARILAKLFSACRKGVIIIDHVQKWSPGLAIVEWLEGSWYDQFVKMDFGSLSHTMGAKHSSQVIGDCQVMEFCKD